MYGFDDSIRRLVTILSFEPANQMIPASGSANQILSISQKGNPGEWLKERLVSTTPGPESPKEVTYMKPRNSPLPYPPSQIGNKGHFLAIPPIHIGNI